MKGKISKRTVDAITPGPSDQFLWDTDLAGFGCKVTVGGKRLYILQYRHGGRLRRYTIGTHGVLTPDAARKEAVRLLGLVAEGQDPAEQKAQARTAPTVKELCATYLEEGVAHKEGIHLVCRSWTN